MALNFAILTTSKKNYFNKIWLIYDYAKTASDLHCSVDCFLNIHLYREMHKDLYSGLNVLQ